MDKKILRWVVVNAIFAALVGVGWYSNYSWANYAKNMVYFASWAMLVVSFLTIGVSLLVMYGATKLKAQHQKDIIRIPLTTSIPISLDVLYDSAIVLAMAASGSFLIATVYTLAQVNLHISKHIMQAVRKTLTKYHPEVEEEMQQLEVKKRVPTGTELDLN